MFFMFLFMLAVVMIIYKFFAITWSICYKIKINNLLESINTRDDMLFFRYKDFISVTAEVFKRKGYKVDITDRCGEDGNGLLLDDKKFAEVWKHGLNHMVDVEAAMKLAKYMQTNSIYRGMLITLGDFKQNTRVFSYKNVIECINGEQLLAMCKEVQKRREVYQAG